MMKEVKSEKPTIEDKITEDKKIDERESEERKTEEKSRSLLSLTGERKATGEIFQNKMDNWLSK